MGGFGGWVLWGLGDCLGFCLSRWGWYNTGFGFGLVCGLEWVGGFWWVVGFGCWFSWWVLVGFCLGLRLIGVGWVLGFVLNLMCHWLGVFAVGFGFVLVVCGWCDF